MNLDSIQIRPIQLPTNLNRLYSAQNNYLKNSTFVSDVVKKKIYIYIYIYISIRIIIHR